MSAPSCCNAVKSKTQTPDEVAHLRALAHDLSNSLEAILQAAYLLSQGKLDGERLTLAVTTPMGSETVAFTRPPAPGTHR